MSFNQLASETFGIDFEEWYQKGYWNNRYIPYSFANGDRVVANISVNLIDFVMKGEEKKAIQIGTVMTHPDYRGQGLSKQLMNRVLEDYKDYDFIYLFANETVLNFYPKFGFHAIQESQFSMDTIPLQTNISRIRKLDVNNDEDRELIYKLATERQPISKLFGTKHTQHLSMFYSIYVFADQIYYIKEEDTIVIFELEQDVLYIYDIISRTSQNTEHIISKIIDENTKKIVFHFTPNLKELQAKSQPYNGTEVLFVKMNGDHIEFPSQFKHPKTSQA